MTVDVGARLRAVREMNGYSQRELAKKAKVTNSTISLIEQNRVSPGVASLKKVLDGIPMSLADFFSIDFTAKEQNFYTASELPEMGTGTPSMKVTGFNRENRALSVLHEHYPPGSDTGPEMLTHTGEEGGFILRGEIEVTVASEVRILKQGDSFYFESNIPHRFRNLGDEVCELVAAVTPPIF